MLEALKNWWNAHFGDGDEADLSRVDRTGSFPAPNQTQVRKKSAARPSDDDKIDGEIESQGHGKNVLIRNKYVREETGTHETLKILDDSLVDSGEETGIDPYNTGGFDRSRNWDTRFRK